MTKNTSGTNERTCNCWNRFGIECVVWDVFIYFCFLSLFLMLDQWNTHEKKILTHEIPTRKKFWPTKYLRKRNFGPTKYPREKNFDPRNTYEKEILEPRNTYKKIFRSHETLLRTLFLLVFKIVENLQCILKIICTESPKLAKVKVKQVKKVEVEKTYWWKWSFTFVEIIY